MAEGEFVAWGSICVQTPCSKSSPGIAALLLKDSIEHPHLYDKTISSKSMVRVKTDTGVKISVREVKLPLLPEKAILPMKQTVEIHDKPEEGVEVKVVFTVHEDHAAEYKGTIEHSVKKGADGETLLEYKLDLEAMGPLADGQGESITEHCTKFMTEIATLADRIFFLAGDREEWLLQPENALPHVTHSLLDIAKKFREIPPWLPIAAHGSAPDMKPYRFKPEKPAAAAAAPAAEEG
jgi:hypothetical protein